MPSITKNVSRQEVVQAYVDINFGDLAGSSGVDVNAIELPPGAVLVGGAVVALTAFNSATSDVLDVGDSVSQNRYANDVNIHATGRTAITPTGYTHVAASRWLTVRWVGVGAVPSAGKVRLEAQYYVENRSHFTQG